MPEFTDEQLLDGIERALHARDMDAAAALIRRLAVRTRAPLRRSSMASASLR